MAETKFTKHLVWLQCEECNSQNYHKRKNKKSVKRKLKLKKYCPNCKKHTVHEES
ncbi:MAG: 50S ribosomal protein L33 [Candidatus Magasanikbacteria bacterium]